MQSTLVDGKTLRRLRVEREMSCAELARKARLAYSFLKYVESGERGASPITARKLALALGVSPNQLLGSAVVLASPTEADAA